MNKTTLLQIKLCKNKFFSILTAVAVLVSYSLPATAYDAPSSSFIQQVNEKFVTLNIKNKPIKEILTQIQKQTNIEFVFATDLRPDMMGAFSLDANRVALRTALDMLFKNSNYTYELVNNRIVIKNITKQPVKTGENVTISGRILDDKNAAVAGATIVIEGTAVGEIADENGNFTLKCPVGSVLEISFVGMEDMKYSIKAANNNLILKMKTSALAVDDVVVTGYFNKSSNLFTGAQKTIKKDEIQKFGNAGVFNVLSMVDPSFKIRENINVGSDPNALPDFFLRGESSFMGNSNMPIFIVDGYEVSARYVMDMDMERIESLTILKDASATVFYGSRAANGVVVVETRRPAPGKLLVTYSNKTSVSMPDLSDYSLMDAKGKLDYEVYAGMFIPSSEENTIVKEKEYQNIYQNIVRGVNTDWMSQPVRTAVSHTHSLYVSGGNEAVTYGLNASYNKNVGVVKQSHRENYSVGFDLTYRIKEKFSIKNSLTFSNDKAVNSPYGSYSQYALANPYERIYDDNGDYIQSYVRHNKTMANPLYNASLRHIDEATTMTLINRLSLDYRIGGAFRLIGSLALNKNMDDSNIYISPLDARFKESKAEEKGTLSYSNGKGFSYDANIQFTFNKQLGKHNIYAGVGANIQDTHNKSRSSAVRGFVDEDFYDISFALGYDLLNKATGINTRSRLAGFLGNFNYSYENRYFVDFSGRLDGSSKYGADNRFAALWSAGIGWNLNNEKFLKDQKWLEILKLRGSIGITGSQDFDPSQARMTYKYYNEDLYYQSIGVSFIKYGNKNLAWQQTMKRNIGLDLQMFERRFSLTLNYYNDVTDGLLLPVTVAPSLGFTSYVENYGKQGNVGFEFDALATLFRTKDFDLSLSFAGNHNKNKILQISTALSALNDKENANKDNYTKPIAMYEEGESLTSIKVVKSLGINPETGKEIFLKRDGTTTEEWDYKDKIYAGDKAAALSGSVGLNVMYKQFSLSGSLLYSFGGSDYNQTLASRVEGAQPYQNADRRVLDQRWKQPGDKTFYKDIADKTTSYATSRFVQKNNYVTLGNVALTYRFKPEVLKAIHMSNLKISLNTNNVFHIATIKRERGLDYPFARQFTFSLSANF